MKHDPQATGESTKSHTDRTADGTRHTLQEVRNRIDVINQELIELLAKRQKHILVVNDIKKSLDLPVYDAKREQEILDKVRKVATSYELSPDFVAELFSLIFKESKRIQNQSPAGKN